MGRVNPFQGFCLSPSGESVRFRIPDHRQFLFRVMLSAYPSGLSGNRCFNLIVSNAPPSLSATHRCPAVFRIVNGKYRSDIGPPERSECFWDLPAVCTADPLSYFVRSVRRRRSMRTYISSSPPPFLRFRYQTGSAVILPSSRLIRRSRLNSFFLLR